MFKDWRKAVVDSDATIRDAMQCINDSSLQVALVSDAGNKLLGTLTDGDIRRALLQGIGLDHLAVDIMNKNPIVAHHFDSKQKILKVMQKTQLHQIPIIDAAGCLTGLEVVESMVFVPRHDNIVILMAGGLGKRLRPLTEDCPKPLLKVGDKPLLETIIENLVANGFQNIYISTHYKPEMIKEHFGNGEKWDINIRYLMEPSPLGTAGAIALLPERPTKPFIVMNGDILTNLDFAGLLEYHEAAEAAGTICVRSFEYQVPYGVIRTEGNSILGIVEKPVEEHLISTGIYVLNASVLDFLNTGESKDMPVLFEEMIESGLNTVVYPLSEYWVDIGNFIDYENAGCDYAKYFALPD